MISKRIAGTTHVFGDPEAGIASATADAEGLPSAEFGCRSLPLEALSACIILPHTQPHTTKPSPRFCSL